MSESNVETDHFYTRNVAAGDADTGIFPDIDIKTCITPLSRLAVTYPENVKSLADFKNKDEFKNKCQLVLPDGQVVNTNDKFWKTFSQRFEIPVSVFRYFSPREVFDRVSSVRKNDPIRLNYEVDNSRPTEVMTALTCVNKDAPLVTKADVEYIVKKNGGHNMTYYNGRINIEFDSPFAEEISIVGDQDSRFKTKFLVQMPIDGYGAPASYLSLLRQVCTNGMVAMHKAFRTEFQLGKDDATGCRLTLDRAIEAFNNEEGYHAIVDRMRASANSWASFNEFLRLNKSLQKAYSYETLDGKAIHKINRRYNEITGDPYITYGIANAGEFSTRIARVMPIRCTLYDLINFATEVSTHVFKTQGGRNTISAWVGDILTTTYDLENSCTDYPNFSDVFFENVEQLTFPDGSK